MIITKRVHSGWQSYKNSTTPLLFDNLFGKYQYLCDSPKGHISIIKLTDKLYGENGVWEIWSNETLFEDCQRFDTLEEAINKASDYLDE